MLNDCHCLRLIATHPFVIEAASFESNPEVIKQSFIYYSLDKIRGGQGSLSHLSLIVDLLRAQFLRMPFEVKHTCWVKKVPQVPNRK